MLLVYRKCQRIIAAKAPKLKDQIVKLSNELSGVASDLNKCMIFKVTRYGKRTEQIVQEYGKNISRNTKTSF
jgi:hypothetical protein